jgi:hypothetical protein
MTRPDTSWAWSVSRVCLLAALGGAGAWVWFMVVCAWIACDYAVWAHRGAR